MRGKGISSFLAVWFLCLNLALGVRIKDVADVEGLTDIQITGFGLITGLRNTGDSPRTQFTTKGVANMLRNVGIEVPQERVKVRNVAAVMVVANLMPFVKKGSKIDVHVSSIGDARSLEGGTLLMSPLSGSDGKIYAVAQGPISIGGFNLEGDYGLSVIRKNHALAGQVPNGAIVQRERLNQLAPGDSIRFTLHEPDFSSAVEMANSVNKVFGGKVAEALDAATVMVNRPDNSALSSLEFLSEVENISFSPSQPARVVLNEKTGTIVAGGDVTISPVAISHGSITISVNTSVQNTQADSRTPLTRNRLTSVAVAESVSVSEPKTETKVLPKVTNVNELADALNSLGVAPRDIISIFLSIKKAGALQAELTVM